MAVVEAEAEAERGHPCVNIIALRGWQCKKGKFTIDFPAHEIL